MKEFGKNWQKYYQVGVFKEKGFARKSCVSCGVSFWTLDEKRIKCGNPPCENYGFIGKKMAKKRNYVKTWAEFEKFFTEHGHTSIPRYPVIDRWRPDLFFTIASIQDFQRLDRGKMTFVYPSNPLVVPQVCLRFPDIPSVGLSGRHMTSFIMSGQHAFNYPKEGYFKDKCIELNYEFLTKNMGVKPKDLVYIEDVWNMPDFSAFGPSLETYVGGLEVVNSVFMEFQADRTGFKPLDTRVIDVGWGHERLVWLSNGTNTIYDCVFGDLVKKMVKYTGIKINEDLFSKYSKLAGGLNIDEVKDLDKTRKSIADSIGIPVKQLVEEIEPIRAMYAIADHTRTLLFALSDGGIPSNTGGGYNLRVLLRRCFAFIEEYNLNLNLLGLAEKHAEYLKPMFPELSENIENLGKILKLEEDKYRGTLNQGRRIVESLIDNKEEITEQKIAKLYESNGITPELVKQVAKERNVEIEIPENFYEHISSKHIMQKEKEKEIDLDISGLPDTKLLFYDKIQDKEFKGNVIRVIKSKEGKYWISLDQTLFYPEGGGQENDTGYIADLKVIDVQKFGKTVLHKVDSSKVNLKEGQEITGKIDWDRRIQLRNHHTAIHIINGVVKKILGKHAWQAGTHKSPEKAHLDVIHHNLLTNEEVKEIEDKANEIVKESIKTNSSFVERGQAEQKFGLGIYQGGHIPEKTLRILEIPGHDIEACSGTHVPNTGEIGKIKITNVEKVQDGVIRITIKAGKAEEDFEKNNIQLIQQLAKAINISGFLELKLPEKIDGDYSVDQIKKSSDAFVVPVDHLKKNFEKFYLEILNDRKELVMLSKSQEPLLRYQAKDLEDACKYIFSLWKKQKKELEKVRLEASKDIVESMLAKIKDNKLFEITKMDRKQMVTTASEIASRNPEATVIIANELGDIVGMSQKEDMEKTIKDICSRAGGSGGGRKEFAQGKVELSKLLKIMGK